MADNTTLNSGTGGDVVMSLEATFSGDTAKAQMVALAGVSGSEGSWTIGVIGGDATNGLDCDITRIIPGTSATHMGKAEDAAHASGDTGVAILAVRRDTAAVGSGTDGDYSTLNVNASGRLYTSATVDAALPAGTNNIGDVDVLSIVPGTAATNLGKAEDAAHSSGDTGVMSLAVRRDADTALAGTDGDYAPLQVNAAGSLKVAITAGAGSGGTSIADGASFTRDTTSVTPVGAVVETSAPTLTNGDAAGLSMTTAGALRVAVAAGGVAGIAEDSASAGGEEGVMILAVRRDTAASSSGTDGDFSTLNTDANGRLHVIAALAATQTLATVTTVSTVTNVATIGTSVTPGTSAAHLGKAEDAAHSSGDTGVMSLGVRSDTAAAASGTTGDYEPFHTDSVGAMWTRSTGELADDAAFTPATSRVMPVGYLADETATDSVDEGDVGAGRITLDRKQIVTQYVHAAAGGSSNYTALSTAAVLAAEIKGSAGKVYSLEVFNINAAARFVRLYNQTGAPASTDTANVAWQGIIPGATTGGGFVISWPQGKQFATGIGIRASTGIAHNDTGALGANELTFNVSYA